MAALSKVPWEDKGAFEKGYGIKELFAVLSKV